MEPNAKKGKSLIQLLFGVYLMLGIVISAMRLYGMITRQEDLDVFP